MADFVNKTKEFIKRYWPVLLGALALLIVAGGFLAISQKEEPATENEQTTTTKKVEIEKGVALSPKSYQGNDFTNFFAKASQAGSIIMWNGDWKELSDENAAPHVLAKLAGTYSYKPLAIASMPSSFNDQIMEDYVNAARSYAEKYQPDYMGLGNEINIAQKEQQPQYEAFKQVFSQAYDAIKAVSPETQVFSTWQLEQMKGLNGGLFGGVNDTSKHQWALLNDFPKADMAVFTTYPGLIYQDPEDIPEDYYTSIEARTDKPVAFTEVGWASAATSASYSSSEAEQARFIPLFFERIKPIEPKFAIWLHVFEQDIEQPFTTMGLIDKSGNEKQAWKVWVDYKPSS